MFESLTDKLNGIFQRLTGKGRLTEKDLDEALRQIRLALLEADVNFKVARELVNRVRERSLGKEVLESLTPGQQVVKVVHEELTAILSGTDHKLAQAGSPPTVLMLVGLQGTGKTTTAAKLAYHLQQRGQRSLLIAADLRRPAAIQQLATLGKELDIPVYKEGTSSTAVKVARAGVKQARQMGLGAAIIDTGGRLHMDEEMMVELEEVRAAVSPRRGAPRGGRHGRPGRRNLCPRVPPARGPLGTDNDQARRGRSRWSLHLHHPGHGRAHKVHRLW